MSTHDITDLAMAATFAVISAPIVVWMLRRLVRDVRDLFRMLRSGTRPPGSAMCLVLLATPAATSPWYDPLIPWLRIAGIVAGALVCTFFVFVLLGCIVGLGGPRKPEPDPLRRGRRILSLEEAIASAALTLPPGDPGIPWGGLLLPSKAATTNFCVVGTVGSGKSLTLRLLMQAVLPRIVPGSNHRAVILDAKRDMVSLLAGMGIGSSVVILNPTDARSAAWDVARDVTSPITAQQIATILVPEEGNTDNRFFPDAVRDLVTGVMIAFIRTCPGRWTLRDVVLAMKSKERLKLVLSRVPETRDRLGYLEEDRTASNILSTAATNMAPFEPIAACWDRAAKRVSLQDWARGEYVLLLGSDESTRAAMNAVNAVIFKRATELILSQDDVDPGDPAPRRTWVFLDECREAKLDGLSRLLTQGRSKGACVVLGFQDKDGLDDAYGKEVAEEILGQCHNKALLLITSSSTAKWASEVIGEQELVEYHTSFANGRLTEVTSVSEHLVKREGVLPSQFMTLPPTSPQNGLSGYYLSPHAGAYFSTIPGDELFDSLTPRNPQVADFVRRPEEDEYLRPWDDNDMLRLGLLPPGGPGGTSAPLPPPTTPPAPGVRLKVVKRVP